MSRCKVSFGYLHVSKVCFNCIKQVSLQNLSCLYLLTKYRLLTIPHYKIPRHCSCTLQIETSLLRLDFFNLTCLVARLNIHKYKNILKNTEKIIVYSSWRTVRQHASSHCVTLNNPRGEDPGVARRANTGD